mmetsp:Transcript_158888/g.509551  ORF Transcript_158888/g.509551 Transcript_158888/m.509551 type:complete len:329 (-) Transcript_158888:2467-3453(-)
MRDLGRRIPTSGLFVLVGSVDLPDALGEIRERYHGQQVLVLHNRLGIPHCPTFCHVVQLSRDVLIFGVLTRRRAAPPAACQKLIHDRGIVDKARLQRTMLAEGRHQKIAVDVDVRVGRVPQGEHACRHNPRRSDRLLHTHCHLRVRQQQAQRADDIPVEEKRRIHMASLKEVMLAQPTNLQLLRRDLRSGCALQRADADGPVEIRGVDVRGRQAQQRHEELQSRRREEQTRHAPLAGLGRRDQRRDAEHRAHQQLHAHLAVDTLACDGHEDEEGLDDAGLGHLLVELRGSAGQLAEQRTVNGRGAVEVLVPLVPAQVRVHARHYEIQV